ncbi:MAG: VPS10 domain-containing protein [Gemmatimonadaceae bacterium]
MREFMARITLVVSLAASAPALAAQTPAASPRGVPTSDVYGAMRWREIGPTRGGRARALAGVPSRPNEFFVGFDNGGVWRTTDYGSTWQPLFDDQPTGSIGAIAVAPSDPEVIYVGSGAGIIRPDLAVGNGVYKSTDGGKTWTHLGLRDSQMIAMIDVDPTDPNRLFVAALGHPYGQNAERGIFRSTDGGRTFEKVLYRDEYTSGSDVRIDPRDPKTVYASLWQQQQAFVEGGSFGGTSGGIFKSSDGGTTWRQLQNGLPAVVQANLAVAPGDPRVLYAMVASGDDPAAGAARGAGPVSLYKSTDAGEHWRLADDEPSAPAGAKRPAPDPRPLLRIGGGDLPTVTVDPTNVDVVYSSSIVLWRTEDGGHTWSAVRGAPGGDDYQKLWINPTNPAILLVVSDQGAVVSANRGASWSNWYNQPTAAMYHASTDNDFPYRVCGGQQDSGSACVASRSMDGEITFHDWHPVNIQEYGIAAPDPRDPDLVFGSMRTDVSLYDRKTGQTTYLGPDRGGPDTDFGRNVRTMPIHWSSAAPDALFYASNVVWKTTDRGRRWTRISPDLTRRTWAAPANAGKYASTVTPKPQGAITALGLSPRAARVIWAGTDDGNIQVTTDGGARWANVTPPRIAAWTRIFNIDAGHFDTRTAYAAANTFRLDDLSPHFWRTHDGGATWTEIDSGIAPGAVANAIREDPRTPGLLYAATDAQVWVSFDDGDHWESLKQNMPTISVRDLLVKDDSTCLCSDLIAATHGRGFWILDDVTPLRQAAAARAARSAYLFRPAPAVRVRAATNDPTPWPPEVAAGENPPPGAILDYYLASDAAGPVRLEILDDSGAVVRSYASDDPAERPHPALDPAAYDALCQRTPGAAHCALPLYWPAPPMAISATRGMHRVSWDLRYAPIPGAPVVPDDDQATGAVPHRTYPAVNAPWAPSGAYTVRLTVGGERFTQPLTVRLDPRVRAPAAGLAQQAALSREMYVGARAARAAYARARALVAALDSVRGPDADAFRAQVESLAPAPVRGTRAGGGGPPARAGRPEPATLDAASDAMLAAAMAMQRADVPPTSRQVDACRRARERSRVAMARWRALSGEGLAALNARRRSAGQEPIALRE